MLDKLKNLWNWIDGLSSGVKTLVIVVLIGLLAPQYIDTRIGIFRDRYGDCFAQYKIMAEKYALTTAPLISKEIEGILDADPEIKNVILLNYHNTKSNLSGYSYLYLTALTEETRDIEWRSEWKELDYVYYSSELARIHNRKYLRIDSLSEMGESFPKLGKKVKFCEANSAAFYPINGVLNPLGMIVILYDKPKKYYLGYYQTIIAPHMERLTTLLDYSNITNEIVKE